ncbi:MAG: group 1 truncated hemoglobin [Actinobacteria bacterium]|nr:group 1 truncated hemoglobin [Actinomycetota bacterium]MBU1609433.1 group 1 truncated hemoglobin [Actinomycetota bacterium]MBU2315199.1 group 1 truncated hemoglobin [Actinomycetota bacterium]MBU2384539.1 group 1 truncated hemoglobin [Actinomycetota bacterium]
MMTLYERLGGAAAVEQLVDELSRRLLDDPRLGPAFAELNLDILQQHRAAYLTVILDGPEEYEGRSMREAHQPLGLTADDMDAFLAVLRGVLEDAAVDGSDASAVVRAIERLRPAIVAADPPRP